MTNAYSRRFTRLVIAIAFGAALFWILSGAPARGFKAFTSVLIVACPCALALAAPFALGTVQRLLARRNIFLKNTLVLERLAAVRTIVFDKTGTLTSSESSQVIFNSADSQRSLTPEEQGMIAALAGQSTHPHARSIHDSLYLGGSSRLDLSGFRNCAGEGIEAEVQQRRIQLGSKAWLRRNGVEAEKAPANASSSSVAIDGEFRGTFLFKNTLRPETREMLRGLSDGFELALLSGDNDRERARFRELLGTHARLHFNQSPLQKLEFIRDLQNHKRTVMMVGDGLNDAGALKQSDVGVAVVERLGTFSPASDVILEAGKVTALHRLLTLARRTKRVVQFSFILSAVYNAVGISIAAAGILSPLICAVLMPLSSATVVLFACGAAAWSVSSAGLAGKESASCMS